MKSFEHEDWHGTACEERNLDKVSIVIPAYNAEKNIKHCIDSVLNQTYENIEIVVINDGSVDKTGDILAGYNNSQIIIINKDNAGVSVARNTGLETITGEFVAFVDSDDTIAADYVEKQVNALKRYGADLSICGYSVVDQNLKEVGGFPNKNDRIRIRNNGYISQEEVWLGLITHESINSVLWNKMFRVSLLSDLRFDENIAIGEDMLFIMQYIVKCNAIYFLSDRLYKYYSNPTGAMQSIKHCNGFNVKWLSEWEAIKMFDAFIHEHGTYGTTFEEALFAKKVTIADKILKKACSYGFESTTCTEMEIFMSNSKARILTSRFIGWKWKIKLLWRY